MYGKVINLKLIVLVFFFKLERKKEYKFFYILILYSFINKFLYVIL